MDDLFTDHGILIKIVIMQILSF